MHRHWRRFPSPSSSSSSSSSSSLLIGRFLLLVSWIATMATIAGAEELFYSLDPSLLRAPGNLALCNINNDRVRSCLGRTIVAEDSDNDIDVSQSSFPEQKQEWEREPPQAVPVVGMLPYNEEEAEMETETDTPPLLEWRYENGLLRAATSSDNDGKNHHNNNNNNNNNLCLGPSVSVLHHPETATARATPTTKPHYELALHECPPEDDSGTNNDDDGKSSLPALLEESKRRTASRHMRFLITSRGRIQSLAPVRVRVRHDDADVDVDVDDDIVQTNPYCLTVSSSGTRDGRAYLAPCESEHGDSESDSNSNSDNNSSILLSSASSVTASASASASIQEFDVYGTYSDSFVLSLESVWGSNEPIRLAYQVGIPSLLSSGEAAAFPGTDSAAIFIAISSPTTENSSSSSSSDGGLVVVLDEIPIQLSMPHQHEHEHEHRNSARTQTPSASGILSVSLRGHEHEDKHLVLDGSATVTATLRTTRSDGESPESESSAVFVGSSEADSILDDYKGIHASSTPTDIRGLCKMLSIAVGALVGCFLFSAVVEKSCKPKTRAFGTTNSDGATVCLEDDLGEDDDEDDDDLEDGYGFGVGTGVHLDPNQTTETASASASTANHHIGKKDRTSDNGNNSGNNSGQESDTEPAFSDDSDGDDLDDSLRTTASSTSNSSSSSSTDELDDSRRTPASATSNSSSSSSSSSIRSVDANDNHNHNDNHTNDPLDRV